jgi:GH25 family lysozyme M1 (1,4-beta-N-acetylmuramidase)
VNFKSFLRHLQGERPGMGSELVMPTPRQELLAQFSPAIAVDGTVLDPDVSFYQAVIDFEKMKLAGAAGVIIRAGQRTWVDSRFRENWPKAKAAGLPRGSYWLYDSREDPKKQAALWWSLVKDDPGELVHAADFEESYSGPYGSVTNMRTFVQEFQRLSGLPDERIAIYSAFYWWLDRTGGDPYFARFPLWLAWYADMSVVRIPLPWVASDLLLWQYTSSGDGTLYGVSSKEIDLNWYCCSMEHYRARFGLDAVPPPSPQGDDMTTYSGVAPTNIDTWNDPNGTKSGVIKAGTKITGPAPSGTFTKLTDPAVYTKSSFLGSSWYKPVPVMPPPVDPPPPTTTLPDLPYTYTITIGQGSPYQEVTIAGSGILKPK